MSTMIDPKQALLARAASIIERTSATVLWKYTDEDGKDFYLSEKKVGTLKSPHTGKSFTAKPERSSLSDVGKELKEDDAKVKGALWKYTDGDGGTFYLPERVTGTLKSPHTGRSFTPKAEKMNFGEINKAEKTAALAVLWKYTGGEGGIFYLTEKRVGTLRSPITGKSFPAKGTRVSLPDVAKELRLDSNPSNALWEYTDPEGNKFYLAEHIRGTIKSPVTGKSFSPKPLRVTISEVGMELRDPEADYEARELQALETLLAAKGYNPADAAILRAEGMGQEELVERLKEPGGLERTHALVKLASTEVVAALTNAEKKVVDAFYEKKPADGGMLTTDGKILEKNGLGGKNFAKWEDGKIVVDESRPQVASDQEILRYMKKSIPKNVLAPHTWFRSAKTNDYVEVAEEFIKQGDKHPAIEMLEKAWKEILEGIEAAQRASAGYQRAGAGHTADPELVIQKIYPKIKNLGEEAFTIAKQLKERLT